VSANLAGFSMWELFRSEVETHAKTINEGLLALEREPGNQDFINAVMRAAHSIKGAARVVRHAIVADVAHAMEDRLVAAQRRGRPLAAVDVQRLLDGVDLLVRLSPSDEGSKESCASELGPTARTLINQLAAEGEAGTTTATPAPPPPPVSETRPASGAPAAEPRAAGPGPPVDRSIRLTAQSVTRMMGLAGEAVVSMRWLEPFAAQLGTLKRHVAEVSVGIERLADALATNPADEAARETALGLQQRMEASRADLTELIASLEGFALRQDTLSTRLYREVLATRMRPFADLTEGFPRLVRDLSKQLDKRVRLQIDGKDTEVDRDVAAALEAPLVHAIRNAIDHGIESGKDRVAAGKSEDGTVRLSAWHRAGMLRVEVADDGRGVDLDAVRRKVSDAGLADAAMVERLSEQELLAFLFLPGFTTVTNVTDVSGRGVGLDVVSEFMKAAGGRVQVLNRPGAGVTLRFDLPVTLSILRALIVEVSGEPYAIPLTRVERVRAVPRNELQTVEGRSYVTMSFFTPGPAASAAEPETLREHNVGLVSARQILETGDPSVPGDELPVVVVRERDDLYGLVVDRLLGDHSVVVRPLDERLGKVKDIAAAGFMSDGTPLLVVDVDDLIRSIDLVLEGSRLAPIGHAVSSPQQKKRILVVDDSITVREVERQLLETRGYQVDVAVDGIDGWNAVRTGHYDLVVTDIDMPRLDGIEFVRRIRGDARLTTLPVMIVSYKERAEDRLRGLDAGASYYLTKASFQDETFLRAVEDLIGKAIESGGRS
jgi:two-component system sensor histidine kinase and response regulator WspE